MKFLSRTILVALGVLLVSGASLEAQQSGIVFLNSERLRQEAPSLQAARERIEQQMEQLETQADSALSPLRTELEALAMEFEQQQGMMTPDQREQRRAQITQRQQELQRQGMQWEQRAAQMQNQILAPAMQRVSQVIEQVRSENDYAYVLDVATGAVLAADSTLDITDEVLRRLRATASQGG